MARIEGVDPQKTSFPMRYVFKKIRKMLGRDLTPQKIAARVPRVFWVTTFTEYLLGQKAKVPQRLRSILLPAHGGTGRLSVLNRRQLCRWQNLRLE